MWRKKKWEQKESRIEKSHLPADPVHMMISIPMKYAAVGRAGRSKNDQHPDNKSYNLEHNFGRSFALAEAMKENEDC